MRKIILVLVAFFAAVNAQAQELRATVKVLSPEIQTTNKDVFVALENTIQSFLNKIPSPSTSIQTKKE